MPAFIALFAGFLSCLLGSEQTTTPIAHLFCFLSCLLGSELHRRLQTKPPSFLSCLLGSELHELRPGRRSIFLSCLLGSERKKAYRRSGDQFLSCLLGSERWSNGIAFADRFLSCLLGSEQAFRLIRSTACRLNQVIRPFAPFSERGKTTPHCKVFSSPFKKKGQNSGTAAWLLKPYVLKDQFESNELTSVTRSTYSRNRWSVLWLFISR